MNEKQQIFEIIDGFKKLTSRIKKDNDEIKDSMKNKDLTIAACKKEYKKLYAEHEELKRKYVELEKYFHQEKYKKRQNRKREQEKQHNKKKKRRFILDYDDADNDADDEFYNEDENNNDNDNDEEFEIIKVKKNSKKNGQKKQKQKQNNKKKIPKGIMDYINNDNN